eukprot:COSAG02_NODE_825_length_16730_cov_58.738260_14_plen_122_part_00
MYNIRAQVSLALPRLCRPCCAQMCLTPDFLVHFLVQVDKKVPAPPSPHPVQLLRQLRRPRTAALAGVCGRIRAQVSLALPRLCHPCCVQMCLTPDFLVHFLVQVDKKVPAPPPPPHSVQLR